MSALNKYLFLVFCFIILSSISSLAQLAITPSVTNATCPDSSNGSISVIVSGGTTPYTYQWLPDLQTTSSITGISPGTYSITVTDNIGSSSTASYVVGPTPFADNADIQSPFCTSNGHIVLIPIGGTAPYQFSWSTGSTNQSITSIGEGVYSVVVTDANNCSVTYSYPLTETECFVTPEPYFTPNGDGINDTWFISNAQYFDNAHVIVFDRWGTRVHEQRGTYEPWNGKSYLGISVPVAVYYYFFYQEKDDKQKNSKSGSVTIMR
ncbi:MAG: gliding motility-associated C-terminal domain-containing protein [Bacteroidetes bacterium]|nr:gliding motility-associated C-terminal domain-containing protein [Bacteroidota bacterium]